jgi:hypothetical protein
MRLFYKIMIVILITLSSVCLLGTIYIAIYGYSHCFTKECVGISLFNIPTYFFGIIYNLVLLYLTIKIYTVKKILFVKSCAILSLFGMFISLSYGLCVPCLVVLAANILYFISVLNFLRSLNVRI